MSAVVLHDDVLEQFLVKLKQHLESIQVCLGKIESWLLEPKSNIKFLGETFGSHVRNKLDNVSDVPMGDDYISSDLGVCPRCFCKIDAHTPVEQGHYSQCDIYQNNLQIFVLRRDWVFQDRSTQLSSKKIESIQTVGQVRDGVQYCKCK